MVFAGGVCNIERLYRNVPKLLCDYIFGKECATEIKSSTWRFQRCVGVFGYGHQKNHSISLLLHKTQEKNDRTFNEVYMKRSEINQAILQASPHGAISFFIT